MEFMIEQSLDHISQRLKQDETTTELGYDIASFSHQFTKTMIELRKCQNLSINVNKAVTTFIPEGKKLAESIWRTFETFSMWTTERTEMVERLETILTAENILDEVVDSILWGCECRKKGKE